MRKALLACTGMTFALLAATSVVAQSPSPGSPGGAGAQGDAQRANPPNDMRGTAPGAGSGAERPRNPSGTDAAPDGATPRAQGGPAREGSGNRNVEGQRDQNRPQDAQRNQPGAPRDAQNPANEPNRNVQQRDGGQPAEQRAGSRGGDVDTTGSVDITAEKRTTIHQSITRERVPPVRDVNFSVNVGVEVPRTVELRPLPASVVEVVPQYRGYRFFVLADGRIVIVQPTTYKIVTIITA